MRTFTRLSLVAGLAVFAQMASAELQYNVLEASAVFNNGDTVDLGVSTNGNSIDFNQGGGLLMVGDGAYTTENHNAAVVTIIYTVESDEEITGLDLVFTGMVGGMATLGYAELVEAWDADSNTAGGILAQTSGSYDGAGIGGTNGAFVNTTHLDFEGGGVFSYKVKKTFVLANLDSNPEMSFAALGLVEQNAVPEPATMGALAVGALGLLARRRRK